MAKKKAKVGRVMTVGEFKVAAKAGTPVRFIYVPYNPQDFEEDWTGIPKPALSRGYYVGSTDIDPEDYDDDTEPLSFDFPEGWGSVHHVEDI